MSGEESYAGEEPDRVDVGEETFLRVIGEATKALEEAAIEYGLMGGIASAVFGRPRWTLDVDIFLRPQDAQRAQDALAAAGFEPKVSQHNWLLKCVRDRVLVDLIFTAKGGIYLDDEMLARLRRVDYKGLKLRLVPPEDVIVMKAIASDQDTPRYWHDALGIIGSSDLDWEYLLNRSRIGPRRVLSLLVHAQADDMLVPDDIVRALYRTIYDPQELSSGKVASGPSKASGPIGVHRSERHMEAHLRERLAEDPRVNELNIDAAFSGRVVTLTGRVTTADRREAVGVVAAELLPGFEIRNDVTLIPIGEDGRAETVA